MPNYLYNGIELPALPEWDKEKYPYAFIGIYDGEYYVVARTIAAPVVLKDGVPKVATSNRDISYPLENDIWGEKKYTSYRAFAPVWAGYDIYYSDSYDDETLAGTLYLAASDPVPVTTLTARDLYKIINGKPTKLTLYKKVGGKLIPLDEHTKEVNHD